MIQKQFRDQRPQNQKGMSFRPILSGLAICLGFIVIRYLYLARPFVGSADFFYFILNSRDLASGIHTVSTARYFYFPGIFCFWRVLFLITPGTLNSLQWGYIAVLILDASLIGLIITDVVGFWELGVFAGAIYLLMGGRVEALCGTAEAVATVPYLTGLYCWLRVTRWNSPVLASLFLACGFGIALFIKQQAGLLSIGAIALFPAHRQIISSPRGLLHWCLLPLIALAVFLTAMFLEGGGLQAVRIGVTLVKSYPSSGSWLTHLNNIREITQPLSNLFISSLIVWLAQLFMSELPLSKRHNETWGIALFSTLGGLLQFSKRGYYHYAVLILPAAIIASMLGLCFAILFFRHKFIRLHWLNVSAGYAAIGALFIFNSAGAADFVHYSSREITEPSRWLEIDGPRKTFQPLCDRVTRGSQMMLIPTRQDVVHWLCGTVSPSPNIGYGWGEDNIDSYFAGIDHMSSPEIFLFTPESGRFEQGFFLQNDRASIVKHLHSIGYRETFLIPDGSLYQRSSSRRQFDLSIN